MSRSGKKVRAGSCLVVVQGRERDTSREWSPGGVGASSSSEAKLCKRSFSVTKHCINLARSVLVDHISTGALKGAGSTRNKFESVHKAAQENKRMARATRLLRTFTHRNLIKQYSARNRRATASSSNHV